MYVKPINSHMKGELKMIRPLVQNIVKDVTEMK